MPSSSDQSASSEGLISSAAFLSVLTRAEYGFVQLNSAGEITASNQTFADLTGYSREDLEDAPLVDVLTTVPPSLGSAFSEGSMPTEPKDSVLPLETAEGENVSCRVHVIPLPDEEGIVGLIPPRATSERDEPQLNPKHDEKTAAKAFVALADSLSDGIIVLDTTSQIQYANPAVNQILGYAPEELVGESQLRIIPERLREAHLEGLKQYLETGERNIDWTYVELPGQHRDGHEVPLGISLNDFVFEGDRYFVGLFRDISERKEVEQALRDREEKLEELVEELEESNERLEQFAYAASHDLQEPLRMVRSYLNLIERRYGGELDEDAREFIDFAVDGAERMSEMIQGLLQYSRIDTRGDPFEPTDLDEVLADVRDDLEVRIEETDARITTEELPEVMGDAGQLRQVFQNLLDNAIEYSGDEPPEIEIAAERDDDEWVVRVSDEGVGMDPDDFDRIFEVFQSLDPQGRDGGTGIGLALCKRIVERHGGEIWVDSSPGEGATFSFTLPAIDRTDS